MSDTDDPKNSDEDDYEPIAGIEEAATGTADQPDVRIGSARFLKPSKFLAALILVVGLITSLVIAAKIDVQWIEQKSTYNTFTNDAGQLAYTFKGAETIIESVVPYDESPLRKEALATLSGKPEIESQWVVETISKDGVEQKQYSLLEAKFHFGVWSLLPAIIAIGLCLVTKEALTALFSGVVVGAFMLGRFDITDAVLLPNLGSKSAASYHLAYTFGCSEG